MRVAFLILLLANVVLFFWGQSRLGTGDGGREPERMAQQVAPDKLRIVPPDALKPAPPPLPPLQLPPAVPTTTE